MDYLVRFYSLQGKFQIISNEKYQDIRAAKDAIQHYANKNGFSCVKFLDDEDYTIRATATTPNGRAGRNIACIEPGDDSWL